MPPFSGKQKKKQLQERRLRKKQQDDATKNDTSRVEDDPRGHSKQTNSKQTTHTTIGELREEYKYGADRHGIRSVFLKESTEEVAARKKLSYEPLQRRNFMGKDGIPFGSWFQMPWHECAASHSVPFAVDIPTRGWAPSEEEKKPITSNSTEACHEEKNNTARGKHNPQEEMNEEEEECSSTHSSSDDNGGENNTGNVNMNSIEAREATRFANYLSTLDNFPLPTTLRGMQVSSFERNLDVWRQLWRTVEQSDVVVIVTDVRYPLVHLPISLLHYIVRDSGKPCVVVLNKADLVPKSTLEQWMTFLPLYFAATGVTSVVEGAVREIPLIPFTSLPAEETAIGADEAESTNKRRKIKTRRTKLYEQLRTGKLQLAPKHHGDKDSKENSDEDEDETMEEDTYAVTENFKGMEKAERELQHGRRDHKELRIVSDMITTLLQHCRTAVAANAHCALKHSNKNNINSTNSTDSNDNNNNNNNIDTETGTNVVHIGVVGHPNVGKSSLLNCVRGTKVVSVSATPGHTKHLQTIPLPSEGVILIDSPGLAFPAFGLPRALQAVIGTHQIAQTRDPQSGVAFLASHLPLERLYGLRKDPGADETAEWSPFELCESYARKKGYFVKHGKGALDVHRGSIEILQEAYEGRLVLFFAPPSPEWLQSDTFRQEVMPFLHMPVELPDTSL